MCRPHPSRYVTAETPLLPKRGAGASWGASGTGVVGRMSAATGGQVEICRLPGPAVEKSGEILREASTALKLAQRLDQSSFFVVEELHLGAGICGEPRLENHAEIVGRGVGRARLELLDQQLGGFRRDREVPLIDRHAELLGDEPRLLEVARQLVGRVRRLRPPRGQVASPKLAASLIPKAADPKTPLTNPRMASSESLPLPPGVLAQQHAAELDQVAVVENDPVRLQVDADREREGSGKRLGRVDESLSHALKRRVAEAQDEVTKPSKSGGLWWG